jgi:3-dehydroquinate synthase
MAEIRVTTPVSSYPIHIETGLLERLQMAELRPAVVISNPTVAPLYAHHFADCPVLTMEDGERFKNLDTVRDLYSRLVKAGADRSTKVVALGGGVVGDTAGFVAASYMRGVPLVQVPTTLLSMVDSSVGGKVGVDLAEGKNLVGAFKQPEVVLIDPAVLKTLPESEWRHGMAEVIKHGLLADEGLLDPELWSRDRAEELVMRAVQVKVNVVQRDPYEHGERAYLNLGHTFAHAIEQVSDYAWSHGDAVGLGLLAAAKLSYRLGLCDGTLVEQVDDVVQRLGFPRQLDGLDPELMLDAMKTDKKWRGGRSHFVLLRGMCQPESVRDVDNESVLAVLHSMK